MGVLTPHVPHREQAIVLVASSSAATRGCMEDVGLMLSSSVDLISTTSPSFTSFFVPWLACSFRASEPCWRSSTCLTSSCTSFNTAAAAGELAGFRSTPFPCDAMLDELFRAKVVISQLDTGTRRRKRSKFVLSQALRRPLAARQSRNFVLGLSATAGRTRTPHPKTRSPPTPLEETTQKS